MRTKLLACLMLLLTPLLALADHSTLRNDEFQTLPVNPSGQTTASFPTQLREWLDHELPQWLGKGAPPYVVSGGYHATAGGLTSASFATEGFVPERVNQTSTAITYAAAANDVCWTILSSDNNGIVGWTRVGTTAYYYQCEGDTTPNQPTLPANSSWLMQITVTGSAIAGVSELGVRVITSTETVSAARTVGQQGVWVVQRGGTISLGAALTFCGTLVAVPAPLFTGGSSITWCANNQTPQVHPEWWSTGYPDGALNYTGALNAALLAHRNVILGTATYSVGATINITQANQRLSGQGEASILKASGAGYNVITVGNAANLVTLEHFQIQGAAVDDTSGQYGIMTSTGGSASNLTVRHLLFSGPDANTGLNNMIKIEDTNDHALIEGNRVERLIGTTSGRGYGVLVANASRTRVLHNHFIGGGTGKGRHAVYLSSGSSFSSVIGNFANNFQFACITSDALALQPSNSYNIIADNRLYTCNTTEITDGALSLFGKQTGVKILGNSITDSPFNGILLNADDRTLQDTLIEGNTVLNSGHRGIWVQGTTRTSIISNYVSESSTASSGTYSNIDIRVSTAGVAALNTSVVGNVSLSPTTSRSPLTVNATAPLPSNLRIKGNVFPAGITTGIDIPAAVSASTAYPIDGQIRFETAAGAFTVTNPLASGASYSQVFTVWGAESQDNVLVTTNAGISGLHLTAFVSSINNVTATISNQSGSNFTGGNLTLKFTVLKTTH